MVLTQTILKRTPLPIAILDNNLKFLATSDKWLEQFQGQKDLLGKSFPECFHDLPEEIFIDIQYCLEGVEQRSDATRYINKNGDALWYEWDVNSWLNEDDSVEGIIVILKDRTLSQRNRLLLEKSQQVARIGHWEVNLLEGTLYWSKITREIHEVPEDFQPNLETGINFYKEGHSRDTISELVNNAIATGSSWDTELQIVTKNGREVWVRAIGEAEMVDGQCVRLIGTFQDIDKRKKAEINSKIASERLAQATNSAEIGIWEYDLVQNDLVWDDNMYKIYGVSESDFNGVYEAWESTVHAEDKARSAEEVQQAISGEKEFNTHFRVVWPDGQIRWIRGMATILRDEEGIPLKMIGANWDFTELRNAQMKLAQSEESLQGAFENSRVGMALVSKEGVFMQVNESLCTSLGYTQEELLQLTFQEITHPDDLETDLKLLNEVIDGKRNTYQIEKRYLRKDGQIAYIYLTVTGVKDIDGNLSHFISQIIDISSRIAAEQKLKNLFDLTSKQNESLLNFAHIVSHNLRSHAANLTMITEFLVSDKITEDERDNAKEMLQTATSGLNETIQHLNEVVQVQVVSEEDLKTLELEVILKKVLNDIDALIPHEDSSMSIDLDTQLEVKGVNAYVESVLLNLITNAIKYRHPDRPLKLSIKGSANNGKVMLSFTDNGLGIDLNKYGNKIFGMYKTFHRNKDAKGIGLFITKNQMEAMGGSIRVNSSVEKGSEFILEFKAA
ncbi:PAS domain S-box-containing protein [Robiginitalea myxolifaciens]|uniref:histidine kinase n=1 Tax=Robiginitalea myxolifaciens TaxID=400055 RepID=A0A1I6FVZ4_9FLAO|nr:PAS domain-containing protein [Robiginitalea myxolifaciens]SFR34090.1 PAS domain S-box-containing protein [Robiginitalea myxolifaciens]